MDNRIFVRILVTLLGGELWKAHAQLCGSCVEVFLPPDVGPSRWRKTTQLTVSQVKTVKAHCTVKVQVE